MLRRLIIAFTLIVIPASALAAYPQPTGFVNDFANVIDGDTRPKLETMLREFEKASGDEIAVVTLSSLDSLTVEDVAVDLFKSWGIGKKGKDNGLLFLIAPNEKGMHIEVGYGLEGVINDALAGRILDEYVVPLFKKGEMSDGIASGTIAIVKTITDKEGISFDINTALGGSADQYTAPKKSKSKIALSILFWIIMIYLFIRHPWLFLFFMSSGGGRSGGFGGGFGGFGGGLSGGGGASRGW